MSMVRAGVVPVGRTALYGAVGVTVTAAVCAAVTVGFGMNRIVTGLLAGVVAGIAVLIALFGRDAIVLTDGAIYRRTPWSEVSIDWERVVAGRFALDEQARWSLALDLAGGDERHGELVLLSIPPVVGPVTGAYDLRKREQVHEIREILRRKRVPITILPEIAGALDAHWRIAPPTR